MPDAEPPGRPDADLGPEFSCGYLTVPENRVKPDGRTIKIAVATLKAATPNPKPDPVVWLAGGPGMSGLLDAVGFDTLRPAINSDRDVIFVSQRGTYHSDPGAGVAAAAGFPLQALRRLRDLGRRTGRRGSVGPTPQRRAHIAALWRPRPALRPRDTPCVGELTTPEFTTD